MKPIIACWTLFAVFLLDVGSCRCWFHVWIQLDHRGKKTTFHEPNYWQQLEDFWLTLTQKLWFLKITKKCKLLRNLNKIISTKNSMPQNYIFACKVIFHEILRRFILCFSSLSINSIYNRYENPDSKLDLRFIRSSNLISSQSHCFGAINLTRIHWCMSLFSLKAKFIFDSTLLHLIKAVKKHDMCIPKC